MVKTKLYMIILGGWLLPVLLLVAATGPAWLDGAKDLEAAKARNTAPAGKDIERSISVKEILNSKDNDSLFSTNRGVMLEGYLYAVEKGRKDAANDTGAGRPIYTLYLAKDDKAMQTEDCLIVTVTAATLALNPQLQWQSLKKMQNKQVIITGWLLFNSSHKQTSVESHPNGFRLDRRTAWEVYPLTSIKVDE